jgi:hypothetical protein
MGKAWSILVANHKRNMYNNNKIDLRATERDVDWIILA